MKKYLVIAALVVFGVAASFFLIPGAGEMALMQLRDKKYEEARNAYEQRLAEGTLSVEVVSSLVSLHLQYGAVNDAIVVMEQFVAKNPTSIEARKELGELYQYAQRPDDYLRNLEEIAKLEETHGGLGKMVEMYGASQQYDKQEPALQLLVQHNVQKEPHHYAQLANLQASKHKYAEAAATLREYRDKFPAKFGFSQYEMLVTLLLDNKQPEEAYNEAKKGAATTQNPQEIARFVNILHYRGSPDMAWRLLEPYDTQVKQFPELAAEKTSILINTGKKAEAYELLTFLYGQNKLPDSLTRDFMVLAMENGEADIALEMCDKVDVSALTEDQAIALVEVAMYGQNEELRRRVLAKFAGETGVALSAGKPVLTAILAIARKETDVNEKIAALEPLPLAPQRVLMLAEACEMHHYNACTATMLERIKGEKLEGESLLRAANLYLQIGQIADAREIVQPLYEAKPQDPTISNLRAKIAANEGDTVFVNRWISAQNNLPIKDYKDLFFLAQDYKQTDTALFVAQKMHTTFNNEESRDLLVNALMAEKRYEQALPYLRDLKGYSQQDKNNYLSVLMTLAAKNPKYNSELASFAATQLRGNVAPAQKQALIYALLDAGRADLALPYIKEFAQTQGGEWVEVYAANLDKVGKTQEARDFRMQLANDPATPPKTRRDIGYALLDKGYKDDSMAVFAGLATEAAPKSKDVQQLLYLWGPRLTAEQLDWMTQRALHAEDSAERKEWFNYIRNYADADEMVALTDRNPDLLSNPAMLDTYLDALYRVGKLEAMQSKVSKLAENTSNTAVLRAYARSLNGHNMTRQAQMAYKKLNDVTGGDPEAERNLGLTAFNQADYSETKKYLQNYVNFRDNNKRYHKDDYQAYFYLAESYRRDREFEKAAPYFRTALTLLSKEKGVARTSEMEARAAQSMVAMDNKDAGYKIFEDALKRFPNDALLRADYISTLIEQKDYARAESLAQSTKLGAMAKAGRSDNPLLLRVADLQGYRTFSDDNEILLEFPGERDTENAALSAEEMKAYPWLSYSAQGYDRALLVAKSGYKLKLEPTSGGYMIVPQSDLAAHSSEAALQKELELRYKMLQSRINLETGEHYQAAADMENLVPANQKNGTLLGYTANTENFVGRWKRALALLDEAQTVMPENEDITQLKRDIRRVHSQHVMADYEWFRLGKSDQNIWTVSGLAFVDKEFEVGFKAQRNQIDASRTQRVDGRFGDFQETVERGELFVAKETEDGNRIQASLFANNEFLGAGAYYSWYHELGKTQVYGEYHRPNWDFVEGVLNDAVRDRLGVMHYLTINPQWAVQGGVAVNRYHTNGQDNVADTVSASGTLTRTLKEVSPYLAANYALDSEYRLDNDRNTATNGTRFRPLMNSREVHSVSLVASQKLDENTDGLVQAGYIYERFSDANGPLLAGQLNHQMFDDRLEAQLRASYGAFTSDNVGDSTRVGGYLKWRF